MRTYFVLFSMVGMVVEKSISRLENQKGDDRIDAAFRLPWLLSASRDR
jgi:hypothetical protein